MHKVILHGESQQRHAIDLIRRAPAGAVVTIKPPGRTLDQNDKMWAMLSDVSIAKPEGRVHTPEVWKQVFMNALGYKVAFEMGLDGEVFPTGFRSSRMTVAQMSDMIELMYEYGARHQIKWRDEP